MPQLVGALDAVFSIVQVIYSHVEQLVGLGEGEREHRLLGVTLLLQDF